MLTLAPPSPLSDARHSSCPLCRARVAPGGDDAWVLAGAEEADVAGDIRGYLVGLADNPH